MSALFSKISQNDVSLFYIQAELQKATPALVKQESEKRSELINTSTTIEYVLEECLKMQTNNILLLEEIVIYVYDSELENDVELLSSLTGATIVD